jgi:hypothetical protein
MMIELVLREWDVEKKNLHRTTKYAGFEPEKKMSFLSKLSYHLTYKINKNVFTHDDLVSCYNVIYKGFSLPSDEANEVAEEIESHTGLIVSFYGSSFEFSHLSLQEYLCASYIVKLPITPVLGRYMEKNPAPLAIAVSLSSEPSEWMASLLLNEQIFLSINEASLITFFSRLKQENPYLAESDLLGFAIIKTIGIFSRENKREINPYLEWIYSLPSVKKSAKKVVKKYYIVSELKGKKERIQLTLNKRSWNRPQDITISAPKNLILRGRFANEFLNDI